MNLEFTDHQKWMLLSSWCARTVAWICGRSTGKSFSAAPFVMAKSMLYPNFKTYIMAPTGSQAQETFTKLEDLAKGNIASVLGVSQVFLMECVAQNSKADPFTHDKNSYHVQLYNGSEINTLNSVAKNVVGVRYVIRPFKNEFWKKRGIKWKIKNGLCIYILTKLMERNI